MKTKAVSKVREEKNLAMPYPRLAIAARCSLEALRLGNFPHAARRILAATFLELHQPYPGGPQP